METLFWYIKKGFYDVRDLVQFREDLSRKVNRHLEELEKKKKNPNGC